MNGIIDCKKPNLANCETQNMFSKSFIQFSKISKTIQMEQSGFAFMMGCFYTLGVLCILFGFITNVYEEYPGHHPHSDYTVPLLLLGMVFLALGILASLHFEEAKKKAEKKLKNK